ncbi:MAG: hypothetical protein QOJ39_515, partial [Candidatus Eremiobacteraeota bacterium]|nr:hypothetical protein [Candidatus Eremiobacteraeota bacterium]
YKVGKPFTPKRKRATAGTNGSTRLGGPPNGRTPK